MKTLLDILHVSQRFLQEKNVEAPKRSAERLICHALGCSRTELYLKHDLPLQEKELNLIRELIKKRASKEPVEYIIGKIDFYQLQLRVNPSVLIPRQETEVFVDLIVDKLHTCDLKEKILWDIGTGSGAIGLALKKRFPELKVVLSDISQKAIEVAQENVLHNELDVEVRIGDLFTPFSGEKAHFIVSNPPYISERDYKGLSKEVIDYEPKEALLGGKDGLFFYKRFAKELPDFVYPQAKVFFEIGFDQGNALREIFSSKGNILADWSGKDRFFFLEFE